MTLPRIYLPRPLAAGDQAKATDELARYLKTVLRLQDGEPLWVFNGTSWEYEALVRRTTEGVALEITGRRTVPADRIAITLCQAIPKADKLETIIRHAVELGVGRIIPFFAERSVPRWTAEKSPQKRARWQKVAVEACRQCGRSDLPVIEEVTSLPDALGFAPPGGLSLAFWEEESARGIRETLRDRAYDETREFLLVIGPEGGFAKEEIDQAKAAGCLSVSLGKRVLRVDTAAMTALAVLQYERGAIGGADRGGPHDE
ncbi:MAG: 16S rRNA (uracil(1498)-N(3))-methyltransferase [Deltaproteobacteria bacterium]|nr:16S rRNA (uracil(1498)-N(3))-methyltransferase [Deltaproteobacteria bacterium]